MTQPRDIPPPLNLPPKTIEFSDAVKLAAQPVVSVLMITYNHGPYLAEAIEGVLAQATDFPFELLIGDDCSTDDTRAIALSYQKQRPDVVRVVTSDHNVGMFANFERLFERARGELLALCEGDDYWIDTEKLQRQVALLQRHPTVDASAHPCFSFDVDTPDVKRPSALYRAHTSILSLESVIAGDGAYLPSASLLIRKSVFAEMPPELLKLDYFIQIYAARRGGVLYVPRVMSAYRVGAPSSWTTSTRNKAKKLAFEAQFSRQVMSVEDDFPGMARPFSALFFQHYGSRLLQAIREGDAESKALYTSVLQARRPLLTPWQRLRLRLLLGERWIPALNFYATIEGLLGRASQRLLFLIIAKFKD